MIQITLKDLAFALIRETTENESANEGYKFGQEEETYNIVAGSMYLYVQLKYTSETVWRCKSVIIHETWHIIAHL